MTSMLFLALVIVLVSGLIAYIGDLVGRKMGRKRLSLFGLRPRYTAIVISIGVGMLIAAITLGATMGVSAGVRRAFFTPISALQADLLRAQQDVAQSSKALARSREEYLNTSRQLDQSRTRLTEANQQLDQSKERLTHAQGRLAGVQRQLAQKQRQLADNEQRLRDITAKLRVTERNYADSSRQLEETEGLREETQRKLVAMTKTLTDEKDVLLTRRDQLDAEVTQLTAQMQVLRQFALGTFSQLTFASGQEILSGVASTTGSAEARKAWLTRFLAAAERVVRQRNTELPESAGALIFLGDGEPAVRLEPEEAAAILAGRIATLGSLDAEAVIRLAPANNVTVNGQALIFVNAVEITPNYPVFGIGSEIGRLDFTVTDRTTTAEVVERLIDELLMARIPDALREHQMLMIARRFDPSRPDALNESPLPMLSWADLLATAEKVRASRGKVRVIARTRAPARRAGPLDFTLDVMPVRERG